MPVHLSAEAFEQLVEQQLAALPAELTDGVDNGVFLVEDEAADGEDLLGRYEGLDLTQRDQYGFGELPDRIVVFRLPHLAAAPTLEALRAEVRTTLVHEIAHHFGVGDDRLHELGWA